MSNLINFFFSFDKLFKEKLVAPAFWSGLIYYGLKYLVEAVDTVQLDPLLWIIGPLTWLVKIVFTLIMVRIAAELAVAVFRINDNLSPDKGRSELADIDPIAEARKAAEAAAAKARGLAEQAGERTKSAVDSAKHSVEDAASSVQTKAKSVSTTAKSRTESVMGKGSVPKASHEPTPVKALEPSAADAPKKRGRPKGSTNKTKAKTTSKSSSKTAAKPAASTGAKRRGRPPGSKNKTTKTKTAAKTTTKSAPKKRGPKPGYKAPRDAQGNLLKKDGTPRKKPGPKPKS